MLARALLFWLEAIYRIVSGLDSQEWDSDGQNGIDRRSITVICRLSWIAPGRTPKAVRVACETENMGEKEDLLDRSVELVKIRDLLDSLQIQVTVLLELLLVSLNQVLHGTSHDSQVYFLANE